MHFHQHAYHLPWWLLWLSLGVVAVLLVLPLFLRRYRLGLVALQSVVLLVALLVAGVRNARSSERLTVYVRHPDSPQRVEGRYWALYLGEGGLAIRYHHVVLLGRHARKIRPAATPSLWWFRHMGPDHPHYPGRATLITLSTSRATGSAGRITWRARHQKRAW